MTDDDAREHVHDLVAELALGIASEDDRTRALAHLGTCLKCRRELEDFTSVADALLLTGPEEAPPDQFERKVVERLGRTPARPPWLRRTIALATAAVLGATAALVGGYVALREDLELVRLYKRTLEVSDGKGLGAFPLMETRARRAGTAFAYEGATPWVFVVITEGRRSGMFDVQLRTRRGHRVPLGRVKLTGGRGTFGSASPISLFEMAGLDLIERESGTAIFTAEVPPVPPG
ncbi:MAG TPA: hypothetical protein VHI54_02690 [Actinomycetota bacterium]|nr:hypothetical protein [Actinomycetota bacterium]